MLSKQSQPHHPSCSPKRRQLANQFHQSALLRIPVLDTDITSYFLSLQASPHVFGYRTWHLCPGYRHGLLLEGNADGLLITSPSALGCQKGTH
jgi:hypothetical protein